MGGTQVTHNLLKYDRGATKLCMDATPGKHHKVRHGLALLSGIRHAKSGRMDNHAANLSDASTGMLPTASKKVLIHPHHPDG